MKEVDEHAKSLIDSCESNFHKLESMLSQKYTSLDEVIVDFRDTCQFVENVFGVDFSDSDSEQDVLSYKDKRQKQYSGSFVDREIRGYKRTALLSFVEYISERSIEYENYEYKVLNLSKDNRASMVWTRDFKNNSHSWRSHERCLLWCQDWFFDDNHFSPSAYASFKPGYSVTYQVSGETTGVSTIDILASVAAVSLGGRIQYRFFFQEYGSWSQKGTEYQFIQPVTINWEAPAFQDYRPFSLRAYKAGGLQALCLSVDMSKVFMSGCENNTMQYWMLDEEYRIRSMTYQNYCLEYNQDNQLTIQSCSYKDTQKWYWQTGRLINAQRRCLSYEEAGNLFLVHCSNQSAFWKIMHLPVKQGNLLDLSPVTVKKYTHTIDSND